MKGTKNHQLKFITNSGLFNVINRDVPNDQKFSFILYDLSKQCGPWKNTIDMTDCIQYLLENKSHPFDPKNLVKMIQDPQKAELLKRRKRNFNIIMPFLGNTKFLNALKELNCERGIESSSSLIDEDDVLHMSEFKKKYNEFVKKNCQNCDEYEINLFTAALNMYESFKNDRVTEVYILLDDFETFKVKYNYMIEFFEQLSKKKQILNPLDLSNIEIYPNEIIPSQLYLGNCDQAKSEYIIKKLKITHIINMTKEVPNFFQDNKSIQINYLKNPIEDISQDNINKFFKDTFVYMDDILKAGDVNNSDSNVKLNYINDQTEQISNNSSETNDEDSDQQDNKKRVLIHCAQGKSRSASITIMYLMKINRWTYKQAYAYVKQRRECVEPNFGFQKQLEDFEQNNWEFV